MKQSDRNLTLHPGSVEEEEVGERVLPLVNGAFNLSLLDFGSLRNALVQFGGFAIFVACGSEHSAPASEVQHWWRVARGDWLQKG